MINHLSTNEIYQIKFISLKIKTKLCVFLIHTYIYYYKTMIKCIYTNTSTYMYKYNIYKYPHKIIYI